MLDTVRTADRRIDRLLKPRSVAIVGASARPGALGGSVLSNLDRNGYSGSVYPINPKQGEIGGHVCIAGVEDLPKGVDCAVLAIPRPQILDTLRSLAERGTGAAIVFTAGFAEDGEAGRAEQQAMAWLSAETGMLIEGPNCLGCVNHIEGIPLTFVETNCKAPAGPAVAIVSQSGAMAAVLTTMLQARQVGLSYSVSTGNEAAIGVEHFVRWLVDDPHSRVVAMIVEQFRDPQAFLDAARAVQDAGKTVVLLHPGASAAARESAATHTGAIAGDYQLMRHKVARAGVIVAETLEELGDIVEIVLRVPVRPRPGLAVLGESGAFKALTLDLAEQLQLALPVFGDGDSPALRAALPAFVPVSNPLDITAQGLSEPQIYTATVNALLTDDRVGGILAGIIQSDVATFEIKFAPILAAIRETGLLKPVIFAGLDEGANVPPDRIAELRAAGVPYLPSTERAFRALARLTMDPGLPAAAVSLPPIPLSGLRGVSGVVPEYKAKELLREAGISFPAGRFAVDIDSAVAAAEAVGYPVVLKAQAAALSHKSDAGGVVLNLSGPEDVRAGWRRIVDSVAAYSPGLPLDGMLVERMGQRGCEMIVGAKQDPEWGPVVLAGFGGVTAEILKDVCLIDPEQSAEQVAASLLALAQAPLLSGWRGSPRLDVAALAELIVRLGQVIRGNPAIREIDLNPVTVFPEGQGCVALDALMMVSTQ